MTTLSNLSTHLFAQLDRLSADGLTPEQIEQEVSRTNAIVSVAREVTNGADMQLKAAKLFAEHGKAVLPMLPQVGKAAE